jgi:hypothetical protein
MRLSTSASEVREISLENILTNRDIYFTSAKFVSQYSALRWPLWCFAWAFYFTAAKSGAYGKIFPIAFVIYKTDVLEPCAASISLTQFATASSASLLKRLSIEAFDTYYNRQLLRWIGHVAQMPLTRAPRKISTCWVDNPRPRGCPQMNWGRILKKALQSCDLPTAFVEWREIAADRCKWRAAFGSKMPRATKETPTSSHQDIWAELRYSTVPS